MSDPAVKDIVICMGSSCFARGNEENLRVIEGFLDKASDPDSIALSGKCCLGKCAEGPNVVIDDTRYPRIDKGTLLDLLNAKASGGE
ncbi:MAG: (2Fe-2S) ferredoxin domain-containing protein [Thermoguttaceae bacterium]